VANIAAEMMSILLDVSEGISVENCIGSIWTWKPASLQNLGDEIDHHTLDGVGLVSRNVKGTPVAVEPTLSTCCAEPGTAAARARAAVAA